MILGAVCWLAVAGLGFWWINSLNNPENLAAFHEIIASLGIWGWLALVAIQYVQIVIVVIPSGPIQVVGGALYGPWLALAAFVTGTVLGSATIFALVRTWGKRIVYMFIEEKDLLRYDFLKDSKKLNWLAAILYLIPGTKDVLTYLFALTPIRWWPFILISMAVRTPQTLLLALAGDYIIHGQWMRVVAIVVFVTIAIAVGAAVQRAGKYKV